MDNERLRLLYGDGSSPTSGSNSSPRGGSPLNRTLSNPGPGNSHFSPTTPPSLHNPQPLHPPPGLSLPSTYNNPAGQYQFPQTPAPGFQNYYPQNVYTSPFPPNFNNGLGQPNVYPFYNQSHYVHPMTHMPPHPAVYGTHVGNDLELDHTMNLIMSANVPQTTTAGTRDVYNSSPNYSQPQQQQSATVVASKPYVDPNTVIKPMIENIVGSMSMSNGTYTHFAPSFSSTVPTSAPSPILQRQAQNFSAESQIVSHAAMTTNDSIKTDIDDNVFPETQAHLLQIVNRMKEVGVFPVAPPIGNDTQYSHNVHVQAPILHQPIVMNGKESPVNVNNTSMGQQGHVTPKENVESLSRPQTPGKPSYLEILTKNGPKGAPSTTVFRKASCTSTSTSPVPYLSASSTIGDSGNYQHNASGMHRKSGDFISSTSSNASSTCASASSSPVTKPKLISSNSSPSFYSSSSKGKENFGTSSGNSSGHNSKPSTSKNTPTASPVHNVGFGSANSSQAQKSKPSLTPNDQQRKVLISSQNQHVLNGKPSKLTKRSTQNQFEFEIEDMDDDNSVSNSNWGWKTAGGKGKQPPSHNNNSIQTNNGKKPPVPYGNWAMPNANTNGIASGASTVQQNASNNNNSSSEKRPNNSSNNSSSGSLSGSSLNISASYGGSQTGGGGGGASAQSSRKNRDKEKPRSRKEDRNCIVRRIENLTKVWIGHLLVAVTWLWSLVTDVAMLSFSLAYTILQDLISWWRVRALPTCRLKFSHLKEATVTMFKKIRWKGSTDRKSSTDKTTSGTRENDDLLSLMGPERNITLPVNGDEALKRLHSVKGQDPYSILGVRSDCSDETIRRYYKKQAVLVHPDKNLVPGAEEAFKILARAFELVGEPVKRVEYHQKILQAQAQEKVFGEIGNLFEQLRKKMEAASGSIRCTKCNSRHKKNRTDRPLFAARFCGQCKINHAAREGDLWAERKGLFGWSWHYFACMDCHIWEINEWAKCQKRNLQHLKADSHSVMYRLVAGAGNGNQNSQGHGNSEEQCTGNIDPDNDDWDSLISNLCKGPSCSTSRNGANHHHMANGGCCGGGAGTSGNTASGFNSASGRKRKGKRK